MMATASVPSEGLEDEAEAGFGHRARSCCWVCSCPLPGRTGQRERRQTQQRESETCGDAEGRRQTEAWPAGRWEVAPAQGAGVKTSGNQIDMSVRAESSSIAKGTAGSEESSLEHARPHSLLLP